MLSQDWQEMIRTKGNTDTQSLSLEHRKIILEYRRQKELLLEYLQQITSGSMSATILRAALADVDEALKGDRPLVGEISKISPPEHKPFSDPPHSYPYSDNPAFMDWFKNFSNFEIKESPYEGMVGYRLTSLYPQFTAEKVTFLAGAWLSDEEITGQATKQKTQ